MFESFCQKKHMDVTLSKFLANILKIVILVFVVMMSVEKFGITINPLIAAASAAIFGASFAIQAPLSNYAAGLMVILTRPFVVGNTISVQGVGGIVHEVKLPNTVLVTEDGEKITIPNKDIVGHILYNSAEFKVVEKSVGVSYSSDPRQAIALIEGVIRSHAAVSKTHAPQVGIETLGDSSINIAMRYWVLTKEYYKTVYDINLGILDALKKARIDIPFPQREIRMVKETA
jgi:small conductance mechanosensitive channel